MGLLDEAYLAKLRAYQGVERLLMACSPGTDGMTPVTGGDK